MTNHDEAHFQRVNKMRVSLVGALRVALNGAGLKEKGGSFPNLRLTQAQGIDARMFEGQPVEGYDIERVIQAATALRAALEPFDASVTRPVETP